MTHPKPEGKMASACQVILNRFLNEFDINLRIPADCVGKNFFLVSLTAGSYKYIYTTMLIRLLVITKMDMTSMTQT